MTIEYEIVENSLTTPISYTARPVPYSVLNFAELAEAISARNPTLNKKLVVNVLKGFRDQVYQQVIRGNSFNLTNFLSIYPSITGRFYDVDLRVREGRLNLNATLSPTLVEELRLLATYKRLPFNKKTPSIISVNDTNTEISNWVREGYGLRIDGSNLKFNADDSEEGIFLLTPGGVTVRQEKISHNKPAKLITVPVLDDTPGAAGTASVENTLTLKTRYTDDGQIREAVYGRKVRQTNPLGADTSTDIFVSGAVATSGPAQVLTYTGNDNMALLVAIIKPDTSLVIMLGTMGKVYGDEVEITGNGQYTITGTENTLILSVTDYTTLRQNVVNYSNYLQEVIQLSELYFVFDVPNTGAVVCSNIAGTPVPCTGSGQDAEFQPGHPLPQPRFIDRGDGTVKDILTGLIWSKNPYLNGSAANWEDALSTALTVEDGLFGISDGSSAGDWCLPNIVQLQSLLNYEFFNPLISNVEGTARHGSGLGTDAFTGTIEGGYWTSTTVNQATASAYSVDITNGYVESTGKGGSKKIWVCKVDAEEGEIFLRKTGFSLCYGPFGVIPCAGTNQDADISFGGDLPLPRFVDLGNDTLLDNLTNYIWAKSASWAGSGLNWQEALDLAAGVVIDGDQYRIPTINELLSLANYKYNPVVTNIEGNAGTGVSGTASFIGFLSTGYWSSTTHVDDPNYAFTFASYIGAVGRTVKTSDRRIMLIKA